MIQAKCINNRSTIQHSDHTTIRHYSNPAFGMIIGGKIDTFKMTGKAR